jgi:predicted dehydrogenase
MKVLVIGLGSMGKRRIRLLKKHYPQNAIIGIDTSGDRRDEAAQLFSIMTYNTISEISHDREISCAFVATSPLSHSSIIAECLANGWHVFTELNLVTDGYEANILTAKEKNLVLFLSSTFLYREEIKYIIDKAERMTQPLNYVYHVGQYLPDWHPWEDYTEFFVADKRTNACRELMAIELPWIIEAFTDILNIHVVKRKSTGLSLDYPDSYLVTLEHKNKNAGVLAIDVVSRKAVRNLEIYGEDLYINWDGTPTGLYQYDFKNKNNTNIELYDTIDKQDDYAAFVIENAYLGEIESFFAQIDNPHRKPKHDFVKDREVLAWIDRIEG